MASGDITEVSQQAKYTKVRNLSWLEVEEMVKQVAGHYDTTIVRSVTASDVNSIIPAILLAKELDAEFGPYGPTSEHNVRFGIMANVDTDAAFYCYDYEDVAKKIMYEDCITIEAIPVEIDRVEQKVKFPWS